MVNLTQTGKKELRIFKIHCNDIVFFRALARKLCVLCENIHTGFEFFK
ncbi:MAG: hypothetical protein KatS3mg031_1932 [Chitinophagales bacterium]|nr:MAG: hypothetical protein KatS3mg031_1932 [Chitinophagales bacterium]